jgi:hypothetical protein
MQSKQPCRLRRAGFARIHHPENFGPLIRFDLRFAASYSASITRRLKTHPSAPFQSLPMAIDENIRSDPVATLKAYIQYFGLSH